SARAPRCGSLRRDRSANAALARHCASRHPDSRRPAAAMSAPTLSVEFDPLSSEQLANPFDVLARARKEQPVFYAPNLDLWVVTRHEDVLAVLKDHRTFSSTGALKSAAAPFPPEVAAVLAE